MSDDEYMAVAPGSALSVPFHTIPVFTAEEKAFLSGALETALAEKQEAEHRRSLWVAVDIVTGVYNEAHPATKWWRAEQIELQAFRAIKASIEQKLDTGLFTVGVDVQNVPEVKR